jgi:hypothetical protein
VLVELADDLVEGLCSYLGVPEQLTAGMIEQHVHGCGYQLDAGRLEWPG